MVGEPINGVGNYIFGRGNLKNTISNNELRSRTPLGNKMPGNNSNYISDTNQLGGVGQFRSQFSVGADGVNKNELEKQKRILLELEDQTEPEPPQEFIITVTAPNADSYYALNGEDRVGVLNGENPTININTGDTLKLIVKSFSYPLWIKSLGVTGISYGVPDVINNGALGGNTITWTPNTKGTYYYISEYSEKLTGTITVT
tara:strand:- start:17 stop:622 length:606 start_codon:yes stop_codon:yes gene_type:complete